MKRFIILSLILLVILFLIFFSIMGAVEISQRDSVSFAAALFIFRSPRSSSPARPIDLLFIFIIFLAGFIAYVIYTNTSSFRKHKAFKRACSKLPILKCEVTVTERKSTEHISTFVVQTEGGEHLEIIHPGYISKKVQNENALTVDVGNTGTLYYREFNETKYFEKFEPKLDEE